VAGSGREHTGLIGYDDLSDLVVAEYCHGTTAIDPGGPGFGAFWPGGSQEEDCMHI